MFHFFTNQYYHDHLLFAIHFFTCIMKFIERWCFVLGSLTGARIKAIRIMLGKTQSDFANSINKQLGSDGTVTRGTVNNWEHGRNLPNKRRLKAIADIANVSVNFLLNGNPLNIDETQNFYNKISSKSNLTDEEKMKARELSITVNIASDFINRESHKIYKDAFFNNLTPEESVLATEVATLFNRISYTKVPNKFLGDLSVYLAGITDLIAGSISKAEFSEFQDAFNDSINKNFK